MKVATDDRALAEAIIGGDMGALTG